MMAANFCSRDTSLALTLASASLRETLLEVLLQLKQKKSFFINPQGKLNLVIKNRFVRSKAVLKTIHIMCVHHRHAFTSKNFLLHLASTQFRTTA